MGICKWLLRKNFLKPSLDFQWTKEKNIKLFSYINDKFSSDYLVKSKNRLEIKQAFIDFFEPVGYVLFRLKNDSISLRIFPYKTQAKDSKHIKSLVSMIIDNDNMVSFDYKGREDQIVIDGKLRRDIFNSVRDIKDEQINKKELIKYIVREALQLESNDIILIKKKQIFIKLLQNIQRKEISNDMPSEANRYNGYSEVELKKLNEEYFDLDSMENFLQLLSIELFKDLFLQKKIDYLSINGLKAKPTLFKT